MRKLLIATMSAGTLLGTMALAQAMPLANVSPAISSDVAQVRFGCGPGAHPNPWGRCVPNGFGRGFYGRGPGWHRPGFGGPRFHGGPGYGRGPGYHRY